MLKYSVRHIDPIQASLTTGVATVVVCVLTFSLTGVADYFEGEGAELLRSIPLRVFYYALFSSLTAFASALAYNIAAHYTGGVTITLREKSRTFGGPKTRESHTIDGPPQSE